MRAAACSRTGAWEWCTENSVAPIIDNQIDYWISAKTTSIIFPFKSRYYTQITTTFENNRLKPIYETIAWKNSGIEYYSHFIIIEKTPQNHALCKCHVHANCDTGIHHTGSCLSQLFMMPYRGLLSSCWLLFYSLLWGESVDSATLTCCHDNLHLARTLKCFWVALIMLSIINSSLAIGIDCYRMYIL